MKIYIVGPGGAGKSTLAMKLSEHYRTPVVHLDVLMWDEGFVERPNYRELQAAAIAEPAWIMEGNSISIMKAMKDDVDVIFLLNPPPLGNAWRIVRRWFSVKFGREKRLGITIRDANELDPKFVWKMARWRQLALPRLLETAFEHIPKGKFVELRSIDRMFEEATEAIDARIALSV